MSSIHTNFKHIPIGIGGVLTNQLSLQSIAVNTPVSTQAMKPRPMRSINNNSKHSNKPQIYQSKIKTCLDVEIIKILLLNALRFELTKKTPEMLFDKSICRSKNGNTYDINLNFIADKLKLTFVNERFFVATVNRRQKYFNDLRLFYSFDLNDYLNVITVFKNMLYGSRYLKTKLKISGFYVLYDIFLEHARNNRLNDKYYSFDLSINVELRYVFHNFAYCKEENFPHTYQFLIDNSKDIFSGYIHKPFKYETRINISKFSVPSYKTYISHIISSVNTEMRDKCFDKIIIRSLFDMNNNIIINKEPGFDPLDNTYNNLEPIDVHKFIRNCVKKNG